MTSTATLKSVMIQPMASWRDTATKQTQAELDSLLMAALPFAQDCLSKFGEFFPYAVSLTEQGEIVNVAADPGMGDRPPSDTVIQYLEEYAQSRRDDLRAYAIVVDVRAPDRSDGIQVRLQHRDGQSLNVVLPYKVRRRKGVEYDTMSLSLGTKSLWP